MINSFTGEYRFLSNFYGISIYFEGITYPSVEHAYQASKTLDTSERMTIARCGTPGRAKRLGKLNPLRPRWNEKKLYIMLSLVRQKFNTNPLKGKLLLTGGELLIEENTWNDTFWGTCNGVGQNHLGKILMKVREEFKVD